MGKLDLGEFDEVDAAIAAIDARKGVNVWGRKIQEQPAGTPWHQAPALRKPGRLPTWTPPAGLVEALRTRLQADGRQAIAEEFHVPVWRVDALIRLHGLSMKGRRIRHDKWAPPAGLVEALRTRLQADGRQAIAEEFHVPVWRVDALIRLHGLSMKGRRIRHDKPAAPTNASPAAGNGSSSERPTMPGPAGRFELPPPLTTSLKPFRVWSGQHVSTVEAASSLDAARRALVSWLGAGEASPELGVVLAACPDGGGREQIRWFSVEAVLDVLTATPAALLKPAGDEGSER